VSPDTSSQQHGRVLAQGDYEALEVKVRDQAAELADLQERFASLTELVM
jgi:hypothetical protein